MYAPQYLPFICLPRKFPANFLKFFLHCPQTCVNLALAVTGKAGFLRLAAIAGKRKLLACEL